jgi:hypothetical protein
MANLKDKVIELTSELSKGIDSGEFTLPHHLLKHANEVLKVKYTHKDIDEVLNDFLEYNHYDKREGMKPVLKRYAFGIACKYHGYNQ